MSLQPAESRLVVPFAGSVSGQGPLTWGEKALLQDQRETGWALNATGAQNLAPGTTVEQAAGRLGRLISNQPALRVRLADDEHGDPYQTVAASGEVAVEVLDFADDDDPVDVAKYTERLWQDWLIDPIDHYRDWPSRMGIVRHRGQALYQVLSFNHLVIDGASMTYLMPELGVGKPPARSGRSTPMNILELADYEHSEAPRRSAGGLCGSGSRNCATSRRPPSANRCMPVAGWAAGTGTAGSPRRLPSRRCWPSRSAPAGTSPG
ncbi:MAG: hypothetical protein QOE23_375 [Pseudonocardiales bacterium]|jgi:hypothetical protein|nr:hypothetical protein [Pseudonocardiales bacterium]